MRLGFCGCAFRTRPRGLDTDESKAAFLLYKHLQILFDGASRVNQESVLPRLTGVPRKFASTPRPRPVWFDMLF